MHEIAHEAGRTRGRRPRVAVRAVAPGDEDLLRRMFSRLSQRSIYRRFHMPYPRVPEWAESLFTKVGGYQGESLVAVAGDEIVGHALYARSDYGHEAEMAVLVEDRWQSKGVARMLVSELARSAAGRGIETFTAEVLGENQRVLGLLTSLFAGTGYATRGGVYHLRIPLRTPGPAASPAGTGFGTPLERACGRPSRGRGWQGGPARDAAGCGGERGGAGTAADVDAPASPSTLVLDPSPYEGPAR